MNARVQGQLIAVVGAAGHTGRFVVRELERRGMLPILIARDANKLAVVGAGHDRDRVRLARMDDPASLDSALTGASAVINCAGPFFDTALPVIDAALRAAIPYLDVTAEQITVQTIIETRHAAAVQAGVVLLPAAAFYGGLADLLATAVANESEQLDEIHVSVGLDSWHPTAGTRLTGARNTAKRVVQKNGMLTPSEEPPPHGHWLFPAPLGRQEVIMLPFSEMITLSSHFNVSTIESWINVAPLRDLRDAATPAPQPSDESGRSSQRFVMDVLVRAGDQLTRATASGRDIYATSASIIVAAVQKLLTNEAHAMAGVRSLGEIFDARAFLEALGPDVVQVSYHDVPQSMLERQATPGPMASGAVAR